MGDSDPRPFSVIGRGQLIHSKAHVQDIPTFREDFSGLGTIATGYQVLSHFEIRSIDVTAKPESSEWMAAKFSCRCNQRTKRVEPGTNAPPRARRLTILAAVPLISHLQEGSKIVLLSQEHSPPSYLRVQPENLQPRNRLSSISTGTLVNTSFSMVGMSIEPPRAGIIGHEGGDQPAASAKKPVSEKPCRLNRSMQHHLVDSIDSTSP